MSLVIYFKCCSPFKLPSQRLSSLKVSSLRFTPHIPPSRFFHRLLPLKANQLKDFSQTYGHNHSHNEPAEVAAANSNSSPTEAGACGGDSEDHDHIHLRESETEQNEVFHFGKLAHSHSHSHGPNELLVWDRQEFISNPGVRITWVGLLVNIGMAAGKFFGGIVFHSQALMADSVHAVSDMVSDFLTLGTVGLAARGPNQTFPNGYGKIETVGSLAVSSILTMAGLSICWGSLVSIVGPVVPHVIIETLNTSYLSGLFSAASDHVHSHSHSHTHDLPDVNAAWIAAASIVAKEWVFRATTKVAKETNSKVLLANAWHHRVDSLTSLVALVTITSGHFLGIGSLDAVGGLLVSGLVIKAGGKGMLIAVNELIDRSVPPSDQRYKEVEKNLQEVLSKMLSNNNSNKPYGIKELILLTSGPNIQAKIVLETPIQKWDNVLTIEEFELVSNHLKQCLTSNVANLRQVTIEFVSEKVVEEQAEAEEEEIENSLEKNSDHSQAHSHTHSDGSLHNHKH